MPPISVTLLGTFQVLRDGAPVTRFRGDKVRALLAYLATEADRPHARAALAALLWPEQPDKLALRNLTQAVVRLRAALGDEGTLLDSTREALAWRAATACVDVREFEQLARSAEVAELARAAELYGGEFLAGFSLPGCEAFEEWLLLRREQLHQLALSTLARLAEMHERAGDYAALCAYARQQIALEPWEEAAHRQLMRGLALMGDRSAALTQYERCREVLANELGVEPDVETCALYERIRAEEFTPTTRDVTAPPHNLPAPLTPFVGREAELAELAVLRTQPDTRLLTLIGVGGIGKTRLALELARASLDVYADGVFFVSLASLACASELPAAITQALDLSLHGGDPATALLRFLRNKHLLLILDNFEHLLDGPSSSSGQGVGLVVEIVQAAPHLQILVTSRARLNLRGEQIYVVPGLGYAGEGVPAAAATSAAVRLFAQAARRAQPDFKVREANLPELLRICRLVHGIPLGLELAAAWTEMLSLDEIAQEIERSVDFLAADWADAPERQRSMRAAFDWSWRLLSEGERQVLRRLAVFRGGFTREAAETVAGASLRVLTNLMHKSLLRWSASESAAGRHEIHELLRQFASEQLDTAPDERAAVEARHSHYYLEFVAACERRLSRDEPNVAAAEIQQEIGNIRAAWWRAVRDGQIGALAECAGGLWQFLRLVGPISEWYQPLSAAIEQAQLQRERTPSGPHRDASGRYQSKLLALLGSLCIQRGLHEQALAAAEEAINLGQASQGPEGETRGYLVKGQALRRLGQSAQAQALLEHAAATAHAYQCAGVSAELLANTEYLAYNWLCSIALTRDDYSAARRYVEQGLDLCGSLGKRVGEMSLHTDLIDIAMAMGDYSTASHHCEAAARMAHVLGYTRGEAIVQVQQGGLARLRGEHGRAQELISGALERSQINGDMLTTTLAMGELVRLRLFVGDYAAAKEWFVRLQAIIEGAEAAARETLQCNLVGAELALAADDGMEALRHADQSYHLAQQLDGQASQANALVLLGAARARLGQIEDAAAAYERALDLYSQLGLAHKAIEARAGLAQIALGRGANAEAIVQAEMILPILTARQEIGVANPFALYLACYQALAAGHDPRAASVLGQARRMLLMYAERIADGTSRQSFLQRVETNRVLLYEAGKE